MLVFFGNVQEQPSPAAAAAGPVTPDWSGFQVLLLKHFLSKENVETISGLICFDLFRHILLCLLMGIWRQVLKLLILTCGESRYTSHLISNLYIPLLELIALFMSCTIKPSRI